MQVQKTKIIAHLMQITLCCVSFGAQTAEENLFGDDLPTPVKKSAEAGSGIKGFVQFEAARTTASPDHWSKLRTRADLNSQGKLSDNVKWKLGARFDYDAVYSINDFYNSDVQKDQRANAVLRENYLDYSAGNWDFRLGKQHVVWGEMVGFFFADVVSARDMREFLLPDFDQLRTPQWAARAEYFSDDYHAEFLWIPVATYDDIGKPGSEFYPNQPAPPGLNIRYQQELRPERNTDNMNYGLRLSTLKSGWDVSAFYYRSTDINQTFYREIIIAPTPTLVYQARHDRISQVGSTLAKDFGDVVLKGEAVYTRGRSFSTLNAMDSDGVTPQNTIDWAAGLDFTLPAESRFNIQIFQRQYFNYDSDIISDKRENGYSLLFNTKIFNNWEAQATFISSTNRTDWLFRPRVTWSFERNWRLLVGADVFKGPPTSLFGQYDQKDRVYSEVRYSF